MTRKRLSTPGLESWDDVDQCLADIGEIDRELSLIEAGQQEAIDKIKAATKAAAEPLQCRKAGLEAMMQHFAESRRAEFSKARTKQLTFGSVGFRISRKIVIRRVGETVAALKALGLAACIRIKEEPDKDAMKNLPLDTLTAIGAILKTEDAFGYEIDREKLRGAE